MKINIYRNNKVETFDFKGFYKMKNFLYFKKHRFLVFEETISKFADTSYNYAVNGFGGRFKLGEPVISRNLYYYLRYTERFPESKIY